MKASPAHPFRLAPAVFLDRDGVINRVVTRDGKPCSPRSIEEFAWEDGIQEALHRLKERSFALIVVTNQPDIARGLLSVETHHAITALLKEELPLDGIYCCPHDDADGCRCRKPKSGMIEDAAKVWGLDCRRSFMVGDSWKDMEAGRAAGCRVILLERSYNQGASCDYRVQTVDEAVELILTLAESEHP